MPATGFNKMPRENPHKRQSSPHHRTATVTAETFDLMHRLRRLLSERLGAEITVAQSVELALKEKVQREESLRDRPAAAPQKRGETE